MKPVYLLFFGALILLMVTSTQCENILFLSVPFFSHLNPMTFLARQLHKRGHNSYFPVPQKLSKKLKLGEGSHFLPMKDDPNVDEFSTLAMGLFSPKRVGKWKDVQDKMWAICDNLLLDENWINTLKSVNATFAVVDGIFMSRCLTIIPYKLSIPFVLMGAENVPIIHRTPWVFSAFPHKILPYTDRMSFSERMRNSFYLLVGYLSPIPGTPSKSVKAYAPNRPEITFEELLRQAELHIVETDVLMDYPFPAMPNVEYLGGMGARPSKPLEGDFLKSADSSKNGIILVSFGTVVNALPKEHLEKLGEAFKQIKYDVIWRWSDESYTASNVLLTKWMPQNDILGHPKTRLFITHCGNNGQFESLYHGVPMLGFPVFADQPHNGKRMEHKGYGISMDLYNYTVAELVLNINTIIRNPKYKKQIKMASDIFKSRPEHPSVRGARLVDDVIKYGGAHLRSYCQEMPLYQYFMLDIFAVLSTFVLIGTLIVIFILRRCLLFCCRKKEKSE